MEHMSHKVLKDGTHVNKRWNRSLKDRTVPSFSTLEHRWLKMINTVEGHCSFVCLFDA